MSIRDEPLEGQDVAADVRVTGPCRDLRDGEIVAERPNHRQLRSA